MRSRPLVGAAGSLLSAVPFYGCSARVKDERRPQFCLRSGSLRSDKIGSPTRRLRRSRSAIPDTCFVRTWLR
ncbi:hypothetical protein EOA75_30570 [Mesorhizobium sp. M1A.F.Ca.IN.022.07.1.1]|nr:hypothetical protein EOA75_30570 [Mesorhizobium sp. M1A.F.Ca.IN.022.07.1.1]